MKRLAGFLLVILPFLLACPGNAAADETPIAFSQPELEQMLAPVALYPDPLLAQILMAATYPLEVVEAARWSANHPDLDPDEAVREASGQGWDPSVTSLEAFPQILQTMSRNLEWTQRLGDAYLDQQAQVTAAIQTLRQRALAAGTLSSSPQMLVEQTGNGAIEIVPADANVVYVPYYNPDTVYGAWSWPDYPPQLWTAWPGYGWNGNFAWGLGVGVGAGFFFGSWDWRDHRIDVVRPGYPGGERQAWRHDPFHRHGVPYRDPRLYRQLRRLPPVQPRPEYRGYGPALATPSVQALPPGVTVVHLPQPASSTPIYRPAAPSGSQQQAWRGMTVPRGVTPMTISPAMPRQPPGRTRMPAVPQRMPAERFDSVFERFGQGQQVRNESARGHASMPEHAGSSHGSSHGSGHH